MIQSMTAFARAQRQGKYGTLVCELRSINHRYLEMSLRLPEVLHELEVLMRERIREHLKRGKIECFLRYQPSEGLGAELVVNTSLADKLAEASAQIAARLSNAAPVNPLDVLRWPGVLQLEEVNFEGMEDEVLLLLESTIKSLVEMRQREGAHLTELFLQRLAEMKVELVKVRKRLPAILQSQRERLMTRFADASIQLDNNRLEQELVFVAQKIDVTEEMDRLEAHLHEVNRVLKNGSAVGRRLDFLMQELNREANTLGSKSIDADTTRASVELKVLIEQMREQVQNVE